MSSFGSPDLSSYINLTVFDVDPSQLVAQALTDAETKLPGWNPLEGNTEVVLIESMALEVAEMIYAVNRLPGALVQALLELFYILRDPGAPATATVTFTLSDTLGHTIPGGTRLQLALPGGNFLFTTDLPATAAPGASTVTMTVTATTNSQQSNGAAIATALTLLDTVIFVDTVALATVTANGRDPETDIAWLTRGTNKLAGLASTLVVPSHFTAAALDDTVDGVYRAFTVDNWDPTANAGAGAVSEGNVTVAVIGHAGTLLSTGQKANLLSILQAGAHAGLNLHVIDPTVTAVAVTVTVFQSAGYTVAQVQANCQATLAGFLSTDTWGWGSTVHLNTLIALLTQVAGVSFVVAITTPASDLVLAGVAPLASLGAVTINVQGP